MGNLFFLLQSCTLIPGMVGTYSKTPEIRESINYPATVDYTLIKITPLLVNELSLEAKVKEEAIKGPAELPRANSYPYLLGYQDVLRIFVWGNPDLTPAVSNITATNIATTPAGRTIDSNGNIYFPFVGNINAVGLTIPEFRAALAKKLSKYINNPQVEVDVAAFRSQKVFVSGQVKNPGVIPITDQAMTITDAIGQSGGATDNSDLYEVMLTRGLVTVAINLDKLYYRGDQAANVPLQNGDVITVPDRMMRKIFIMGEVGNTIGVNQARTYIMRRGQMSLTEVLADAGGASPFSSAANQIYLMRANDAGPPTVYQLDASDPLALVMAEKFPIQPRDLVFVNPTTPTLIGRFIAQFIPLLSTAYSVRNTSSL